MTFLDYTGIFIENLLGCAIGLILGYAAKIMKDFFAWKRHYKWFWKDIVVDEYDIIIGSIQPKVVAFVGVKDAEVLGYLISSLHLVSKKSPTIWGDKQFPSEDITKRNFLLIGSPVINDITDILMKQLDLPYNFEGPIVKEKDTLIGSFGKEVKEPVVWIEKDSEKLLPQFKDNKEVVVDYATIIKAQNPFNKSKNVIILAGSYDLGTLATGRIFDKHNLSTLKELKKKAKTAEHFQAILEVKSVNGFLSFEIVDFIPLRKKTDEDICHNEPTKVMR